jgi:hypothetical protein
VKTAARYSLITFATLLATIPAIAGTVLLPVPNASFEAPTTLNNTCSGTNCYFGYYIPYWGHSAASGVMQPGSPYPNYWLNYVPDGQNIAFIDTPGDAIYNNLGFQPVVGTTYTLQVDFGWEFTRPYPNQYAELYIAGQYVVATGTNPTQGNWSTFTAQYTVTPNDPVMPIWIQLGMLSGTEAVFDNVRLTATTNSPTPEPSTIVFFGSGLISVVAAARRRLKG